MSLPEWEEAPAVALVHGPEGRRTASTGVNPFDGAPVTPRSQFAIASIGKTMTAVAILQLVGRGVLAPDAPAAPWLPPDTVDGLGGLEGVSIRHLLTMTSGLPDYYDDDYLSDALDEPRTVRNPAIALTYAYRFPALFGPGEAFDYSNTNYVLLQLVLEAAARISMEDYFDRHIFGPARMRDSFVSGSRPLPARFMTGREGGEPVRDYYRYRGYGDGGVVSTAPDLARFYRMLFVERRLLPGAMTGAMLTQDGGHGYGAGIELDGRFVGHSGGDLGFSSDIRMDRASGTLAVILVAEGDSGAADAMTLLDG